ncbi:putative non-specific serine/threonine protein kinase [Helianthus debilis subsp. tardiflorus]
MHCLIRSQGLHQITEAGAGGGASITENYHNLVKGWIFSTMNDQVLQDFYLQPHVPSIWSQLESTFGNSLQRSDVYAEEDLVGFTFRTGSARDIPEIEDTDNSRLKKELYEAAVDGCWWKAKSILKIHRNAATEVIHPNGNTILHVAVEMGNNYLVEKLLEFLKDREVIEKTNLKGLTALHVAALVGNTDAAQLLVQKRKELLEIQDNNKKAPMDTAFANGKLSTCAYLLRCASPSDSSTYSGYHQQYGLLAAILTKQYDLAVTLLNKFSDCALYDADILMALTITFPTDLSFMESFIYPCISLIQNKKSINLVYTLIYSTDTTMSSCSFPECLS